MAIHDSALLPLSIFEHCTRDIEFHMFYTSNGHQMGMSASACRGPSSSGACSGGQLIGGPQARVPLYVPYADFFQYQAGAGRLAGRA